MRLALAIAIAWHAACWIILLAMLIPGVLIFNEYCVHRLATSVWDCPTEKVLMNEARLIPMVRSTAGPTNPVGPPPTGLIRTKVQQLHSGVEQLTKSLVVLEDRLGSVMTQRPDAVGGQSVFPSTGIDLADQIDTAVTNLQSLEEKIGSILSRLGLD